MRLRDLRGGRAGLELDQNPVWREAFEGDGVQPCLRIAGDGLGVSSASEADKTEKST